MNQRSMISACSSVFDSALDDSQDKREVRKKYLNTEICQKYTRKF